MTKPAYKVKNTLCYIYDIDKGQVNTESTMEKMDPEFMDMIFSREAIRQLVAAFGKSGMFDISIIGAIIIIILGILAGIIIGQFIDFATLTGGGNSP